MAKLLIVWLLAALSATTVLATSMPMRRPSKYPRPPRPSRIPPSKDTYFISAPNKIIPGNVYSVSVEILDSAQVEVTAALQEKIYNTTTYAYDKNTLLSSSGVFSKGSSGSLDIALEENFKCDSCELLIQGRGGHVFERATHVPIKRDILSIFIQTDKGIYKPGERVRYRAFAVYQNLQMYKGEMSVEIKEPSYNRMKVDTGLSDPSGVIEGFFDLSDQPPFGDWRIEVKTDDVKQVETQVFSVAQYELPRFEVTVDLPPYVLLSETAISGTVSAKYTYGKPVKGMVDLHVGPDMGPDHCGKMPRTVNVGFEIDGEGTFTMPKSSIRRVLAVSHGTRVKFTAIITESATGVKLNGSSVVQYHTVENAISYLTSMPSVFKPGLPYTAHVQVKKPDGSPPDQTRSPHQLTIWPHASYRVTVPDQSKYGVHAFSGTYALPKMVVALPASGIASFNVHIPKNATQITIKTDFESISTTKTVTKTYSKSNKFIQLTLENSDVKSGDMSRFQVQSTDPVGTISYQVISRDIITKFGTLDGRNQETFIFDLDITEDMGPVANLLVYYIEEGGEVVADSISFNVDGIFKNKVTVGFSADKAEPNDDIKLEVSADPLSKVFILAVDESVLLLKSGNDISTDKVQNGISDKVQMDSEFALSLSAGHSIEVFTKSGLVVITDLSRPPPPPMVNNYNRRHRGRSRPGVARMDVSFASDSFLMSSVPAMAPNPVLKEVKRIRTEFPEAWLWTDFSTNADGSHTVETKVPDTITTWVASAFATNDRSGLGVSASKANVTVFRSFFVSLNYPRSVKRNEQAVIQATVFNYLPEPTYVTVTLKDSTGFQHVIDSENVVNSAQPQSLWVRPDNHGVVYFPIVGKEVGVFDIEVKARSSVAADGVRRQMSIEPEGAPSSYNRAIYLESSSGSTYSEMHSISFPEYAVEGSKKITVGLSGDLIGPSFNNIDDLLMSMPTGCGEQNMIRLTPNLYIAKYLKATGQLTDNMLEDVVRKLSSGYQSQLTYRRSDASFSAFGNHDESGSTWLTAYVARVLSEVREFTYIDPNVLIGAVDWLVERQREDGAFVELGNVIDRSTQGKSTGPALTAYVLLTLRQNRDLVSARKCQKSGSNCARTWKWNNATMNATSYLEKSIESIDDAFSMSLVTYALTEVRSRQFFKAFRKLKGMSSSDGGLMCWKGNSTVPETTPAVSYRNILWRPPTPRARPIDTLITSYALLSYASRGQVKQALPVVKCLTQQKNFHGGFASTQDTSVGLQALSAFATLAYDPNNKVSVTFDLNGGESIRMDIDSDNMLNYQTQEFNNLNQEASPQDYEVEVKAYSSGSGTALAEINYSFNSLVMPDSEAFDVSTVLLDDKLDTFNLMVCTKWLRSGKTGMVVQEIEIPSGFEPDLGTIGRVVGMKRYERRGNMAVVYFDEIVKTSTCYSILMSRKSKVAQSEKTYIHTFNYYNPEETSTVFYHPRSLKTSTICDVCPGCCPTTDA